MKMWLAKIERKELKKKRPFLNAGFRSNLLMHWTCHKAQGGQWKAVFVEFKGYLPEDQQ